jgi:hypothetical protein
LLTVNEIYKTEVSFLNIVKEGLGPEEARLEECVEKWKVRVLHGDHRKR